MLITFGFRQSRRVAVSLLVTALLSSGAALAGDEADMARQVYRQRCVSCHGAEGRGDGMMAKALNPPPASFADPLWQAGIDDDGIKTAILKGGLAIGKSAAMPPHADLARRPGVLKHLVALVRSFGAAGGPLMLDLKGRSDLQVRVEGAAKKTPTGFALTRGQQTWSFTVDSGVREPDAKGGAVGRALIDAWAAGPWPKGTEVSTKTSVTLSNGEKTTALSATAAGTTEGSCWIVVVTGRPAGGFVPWVKATACGPAPHPPFTLGVVPASGAAPAATP